MLPKIPRAPMILALILALVISAYADSRTQLKPGWNLFSQEQDVEMGREVAKQAESQLPILNDRQATAYIDSLGRSLVAHAPANKYPFQFKIVNDKSINAFALPGGFVYVNRGAIEAADNEAQIAGVMAHEIGHVLLRHGTNQASKAYIAQAPLAILGGVLGSNSIGSVLAQLGIGFATNSLFLKYSRDAERQADLMGTQLLHDSGYNPTAMVEFFEKIQAESKGRASEFFSDHPNPENRISSVQHEIEKMGGAPARFSQDSQGFQDLKSRLAGMPAPAKPGSRAGGSSRPGDSRNTGGRPDAPSSRMATFSGEDFQFRYPDNWRQYGQGSAVTFAPDGGIINNSLAYGMMAAAFEPHYDRDGRISLEEATDQLLDDMRRSNPNMRIIRSHERVRVNNQAALSSELSNESPAGGRETDWVVTILRPDGTLYYFVGVAPSNEFGRYNNTFEDIIDSVRFR
jgi:Zn-dependent protease with chaperone function